MHTKADRPHAKQWVWSRQRRSMWGECIEVRRDGIGGSGACQILSPSWHGSIWICMINLTGAGHQLPQLEVFLGAREWMQNCTSRLQNSPAGLQQKLCWSCCICTEEPQVANPLLSDGTQIFFNVDIWLRKSRVIKIIHVGNKGAATGGCRRRAIGF